MPAWKRIPSDARPPEPPRRDRSTGNFFFRAAYTAGMKVLLGVGGAEDSVQALRKTVDRAKAAGDELTVAIVDNPASERTPAEVESTVREVLAAADLDAEIRRVEGDPGARLVELAETEGFEQIALGGGEKSPMGKIRIGTMQEFVLLNAPTTVALVR